MIIILFTKRVSVDILKKLRVIQCDINIINVVFFYKKKLKQFDG